MTPVYLFGPYLGELSWEILRLVPFVAYMKKAHKETKMVVLTRPDRFDLYGMNADIMVPLVLQMDNEDLQDGHGIKGFDFQNHDKLVKAFSSRFDKKYDIIKHYYFDLTEPFRKVKWQTMKGFSRDKLYYDFRPRTGNRIVVDALTKNFDKMIYINFTLDISQSTDVIKDYKVFDRSFFDDMESTIPIDASFIGCYIELVKRCKFVIGSLDDPLSILSLMLGIPLMVVNEKVREDAAKMLNPVKTPIIQCPNLERGVKIYETNF